MAESCGRFALGAFYESLVLSCDSYMQAICIECRYWFRNLKSAILWDVRQLSLIESLFNVSGIACKCDYNDAPYFVFYQRKTGRGEEHGSPTILDIQPDCLSCS